MPYNRSDFSEERDVSRETLADFDQWWGLLQKWNARINLVSKSAIDGFWQRHALDSWQITSHLPMTTQFCLDLGSGAGFPGLAIAIWAKHNVPAGHRPQVLLVESAGKKASFLRNVIRELHLPATVSSERVETLARQASTGPQHVITARAFAPLPRLLTYAHPFWGEGTVGLFLKGQNAAQELTDARKYWTFNVESVPSRSDPDGILLKISHLAVKQD